MMNFTIIILVQYIKGHIQSSLIDEFKNFMMQYAILEMSMKIELQVRFLVS